MKTDNFSLDILLTITFILVIIQVPFFYYYIPLLFSLMLYPIYILIILSLFFFVLNNALDVRNKSITISKIIFIIIVLLYEVFSVFYGSKIIRNLDWELRKEERNRIVQQIITQQIKPDKNGFIKFNNFIPISNDGNTVKVISKNNKEFSIIFFINQGMHDDYESYTFTNDSMQIKIFENKKSSFAKKLDTNWYYVN